MASRKFNFKKITTITLGIFLLIGAGGFTWFKYQMKKKLGGYTEVIDPKPYFEQYKTIGIKNVNILAPDASHFIPNQQLVMENGLIKAIGPVENLDSSIEYIDGKGQYLIPGLTDTHVHLFHSKNDLYLYLANGVTSVWEMFGNKQHLKWKEEKTEGAISPELFIASQKFNSQAGIDKWIRKYVYWDINVKEKDEAREWIKTLKERGFDAIKTGSYLDKELFDTLLDEAKKQNIMALGHLPMSVSLEQLYQSGISELSHVEEVMRRMMNDYDSKGFTYKNMEQVLAYIEANADEVAKNLKENNIAISTSLWLMESLPEQRFNTEEFIKTIELEYANPPISEGLIFKELVFKGWIPGNNNYEDFDTINDPEWRADYRRLTEAWTKANQIIIKALNRNDVTILAGTDVGATSVVPGFSLHDELESLISNGVNTSKALYSATTAPAKLTKQNIGTIEVGKEADLLLLSKNPLEDINNTRAFELVFIDNHYLTKDSKDKLLEAILEANDKARTVDISQWQ